MFTCPSVEPEARVFGCFGWNSRLVTSSLWLSQYPPWSFPGCRVSQKRRKLSTPTYDRNNYIVFFSPKSNLFCARNNSVIISREGETLKWPTIVFPRWSFFTFLALV